LSRIRLWLTIVVICLIKSIPYKKGRKHDYILDLA
jgi:hypothetical protein